MSNLVPRRAFGCYLTFAFFTGRFLVNGDAVDADADLTVTPGDVPVMEVAAVSVTVIDCSPGVLNVTAKVPTPAASAAFAGMVALPSELVRCTVPV